MAAPHGNPRVRGLRHIQPLHFVVLYNEWSTTFTVFVVGYNGRVLGYVWSRDSFYK